MSGHGSSRSGPRNSEEFWSEYASRYGRPSQRSQQPQFPSSSPQRSLSRPRSSGQHPLAQEITYEPRSSPVLPPHPPPALRPSSASSAMSAQPTSMLARSSSPAPAFGEMVQEFEQMCRHVQSLGGRDAIGRFYGRVQEEFRSLRDRLATYETSAPLSSSPSHGPVSTPSTSASVRARRDEWDQQLFYQSTMEPTGDGAVERIWDLPPDFAQNLLVRSRASINSNGCWIPSQASGHHAGYVRINLRNTQAPNRPPGVKIGVNPYLHQLALVAQGNGHQLLIPNHTVSHLCQDTRCMNPDPKHVVGESQDLNNQRQADAGLCVVVCGGCGTKFHPCVHWELEGGHTCLMPEYVLEPGGYYKARRGQCPLRTG